jgi:hypothetical protein
MHGSMGKMCGMCGCDMSAKGHGIACGSMVCGKILFALGLAAAVIALTLAIRDSLLWGFDAIFWYLNAIVLLLLSASAKACGKSMKKRMMMAGGCCEGGACGTDMGGKEGCCGAGGAQGGCCEDDKK